jgi:uncharacterized Zn-finger protein
MTRKEFNQKLSEISGSENILQPVENDVKKEPFDYHESGINNRRVEDYPIDDPNIENDFIDDSNIYKEKDLDGQNLDTIEKFTPVHERKNNYKCEKCDKMFTQKHSLMTHYKIVHEERKEGAVHERKKIYQCPLCIRKFGQKAHLRTHISSIHEGKKPFKCFLCETSFSLKQMLQKHISSVHEGKKPYRCDICKTSYAQRGHLKSHLASTMHEKNSKYTSNST